MKKHRIAVVGCGALAQGAHLPSCQKNPKIELVATCDVDSKVAEMCRVKYGAKRAETDWRKVVEAKDIDVCVLCTHTNLRGEFIIPALEAGKPVYTEKPLAPSREEMIRIVQASRRTGVPVCVGHNRRSSPAILEFKRLLDKARKCRKATAPTVDRSGNRKPLPEQLQTQLLIRVNDDVRSWKDWVFWDEEGIMFAEMVHFIDVALWMNEGHPVRAFAEGSARGNFTLLLRFDDGSLTTLQHTMVGNFDYPKELFEATANQVTIAMDQHMEVRQCGLPDEPLRKVFPFAEECGWAKTLGSTGYFQEIERERARAKKMGQSSRWLNVNKGHYLQLDRFLNHVAGKGPNPCDVESAVPVNRIALKFLESARSGLPVAVGPEDWHLPQGVD